MKEKTLVKYVEQYSGLDLLNTPVEALSLPVVAGGYVLLKAAEKTVKTRLAEFKEVLVPAIKSDGEETDKGHRILLSENTKLTLEKRVGKSTPNVQKLKKLCEKAGIDLNQVLYQPPPPPPEVNFVNLEKFIENGQITKRQLDACLEEGKITFALKARNPEIDKRLKK